MKKYKRTCPECGSIVDHSSIDSRWHCRNNICRKCSDKNKSRARSGKFNGKWKGYKDISLSYFNDIKNRSKKRKHEFNIGLDNMWNQFIKQNKKCIYTNLSLELPRRTRDGSFGNASLDRIDSLKGYTKDNIQWVHKDVNWMKQDFDQSYFKNMCELITNNWNNVESPVDTFIRNNK